MEGIPSQKTWPAVSPHLLGINNQNSRFLKKFVKKTSVYSSFEL
jgi:hypothetical protein